MREALGQRVLGQELAGLEPERDDLLLELAVGLLGQGLGVGGLGGPTGTWSGPSDGGTPHLGCGRPMPKNRSQSVPPATRRPT